MNKPTILDVFKVANKYNFPIFESKGKFNYNLNIWGIRSNSKDTRVYNDLCIVFWQGVLGHWYTEYFDITTDPSNVLLENPVNVDGTAILKEGHHKSLWTFGFHKGRKDHPALIQCSPCIVYRDNNKNNVIDNYLPEDSGIFGINMHRASAWTNNKLIGLYSAGCQVHYDVKLYKSKFIPLIKDCVNEGNTTFSYTLCLEDWFNERQKSN